MTKASPASVSTKTTPPARPYIGGQAVFEGVMMRSPHSFSIVCRKRSSGELVVRERPMADERKGIRSVPFIRGMASLVDALRMGSEAMKFSMSVFEADLEAEELAAAAKLPKPGVLSMLAAMSMPILSMVTTPDGEQTPAAAGDKEEDYGQGIARLGMIALAIGIFVVAPQAAANGITKLFHLDWGIRSVPFSAMTGVMKLSIVIGYMALIRQVPDIRRVFQYHGAEHKTISTYEAEEDLVVANARSKTTLHPRCGTTFLVMVAMVSVVVFSAVAPLLPHLGTTNGIAENALLIVMKLPFLPFIAGITFEIQRIFARYCTTGPLRVLLWPGFLVQKITTIEPSDDQLEVALASLRTTLWRESAREAAPANVTEKSFASYDDFSVDGGYAKAALGPPRAMLPIQKLEAVARRFREVEALLCTPDVLADSQKSRKLNEERAHSEPIIAAFEEYQAAEKSLRESEEALADPELRELAEAEIPELKVKLEKLSQDLKLLLLPTDPRDKRNVIIEVRSGEGGEEAALFAADVFRMLTRYSETKGFRVELLSSSEAAAGGMKEAIALVSGPAVFSQLRFEGGVHRVQRVPATEAQGRIHTSTASVAVLPEADDVEVQIDEKDLEINIAASGGPGGQGVNTTNSAVQIQHKPSGIIVKCQDERSQLKNKSKAMKILKSRLLDIEREKQEAAIGAERRGMVQTAERAQKIRTYNYPQNRVTDHRIGLTVYKLDKIMGGDMDELIGPLRSHHQAAQLEQEGLGAAASGES